MDGPYQAATRHPRARADVALIGTAWGSFREAVCDIPSDSPLYCVVRRVDWEAAPPVPGARNWRRVKAIPSPVSSARRKGR